MAVGSRGTRHGILNSPGETVPLLVYFPQFPLVYSPHLYGPKRESIDPGGTRVGIQGSKDPNTDVGRVTQIVVRCEPLKVYLRRREIQGTELKLNGPCKKVFLNRKRRQVWRRG